jgi:hypothetical protein
MIAPPDAVQIVLTLSRFSTQKDVDVLRVFQCTSLDCSSAKELLLSISNSSFPVVTADSGFMKVTFVSQTVSVFSANWASKVCV